MSNQQPPPAPATVNLNDILREEIAPIFKNMQDQLGQQMRANAAAEVEARERMKADLLQEHSRLQKRVGAMLEEDLKRAPAKPRDLLGEADNDETEASGEEEDFPVQGQASKRIKPDEEDKKLWLETRRMSDEFPEEDWKKVKVSKLMDFYSGHADAKVFKALEADPEVGLRYDSDKAAEKHSKEMESLVGAAAGALISAMRQVLMVVKGSTENCKQFGGNQEMPDAKEQAIVALEDVQGALTQNVAPVLQHTLRMMASAANKAVMYRRKLHINAVKGQSGKDRLAKLQPGDNSLFGKKVSTLIKSMSDNVKFSYMHLCEGERSITLDRHSYQGGQSRGRGSGGYRGRGRGGAYIPKSPGMAKMYDKKHQKKKN